MDPHVEKSPGLALPNPSSEQGLPTLSYGAGGRSPELNMPAIEAAPVQPVLTPIAPPMATSPVQPVSMVQSVPAQNVPPSSTATDDDDTSALDEEWVNKAKAIVEKTKNDPYLESKELGKVKADYLRIRYNKHIKIADEQSR
jgi:hypothetical protein